MKHALRRLIKEELACITQDVEDAARDFDSLAEKLDCMRRHIETIEREIAYEARPTESKIAAPQTENA